MAALEKIVGDHGAHNHSIDRKRPQNSARQSAETPIERNIRPYSRRIRHEELEIKNMDWNCDCSFERLEKSPDDHRRKRPQEIIEEDGEAELVCQFCLKKYKFDKAHLEKILASIR